MDTLECIESRRSIRKYQDKPIEFEKIGLILNAGRLAPSAGNVQDTKFILVTEADLRKQLTDACLQQDWMIDAPIFIVVCSQKLRTESMYGERGENLYSLQNAAAATENMLLAAHDQELGACWVGAFVEDKVKSILGMDPTSRPLAIITVGYADEVPPAPSKSSVENLTYIERWGNRIKDFASFIGYYSQNVTKAAVASKEAVKRLIERMKE